MTSSESNREYFKRSAWRVRNRKSSKRFRAFDKFTGPPRYGGGSEQTTYDLALPGEGQKAKGTERTFRGENFLNVEGTLVFNSVTGDINRPPTGVDNNHVFPDLQGVILRQVKPD